MAHHNSAQALISKKYIWFSILLSAVTLAVLIYISYEPGIFEHLKWKRMHGFAIATIVMVLRVWFNAARMRYLANNRLSWTAAFRISITWDFASAVTPSTIGGGPVASLAMTRENLTLGEASAIVLYCIMLEQILLVLIIPLTILASFYVVVVPESTGWFGEGVMIVIYIVLLFYAFLLSYSVLVKPSFLKKAVRFVFSLPLLNRYKTAMEAEAENLEGYAETLGKKPVKFLLNAFILSALSFFAKVWIITIVVLSMLPADVFLSFMRSIAMTLAGTFIPTPGGSGGQETLFYLFQGPLMERPGFSGLAVFMWRLISFYIVIATGMMVMSWYMNEPKMKDEELENNNQQ